MPFPKKEFQLIPTFKNKLTTIKIKCLKVSNNKYFQLQYPNLEQNIKTPKLLFLLFYI